MRARLHVRADEGEGYDVSILCRKLQAHVEVVFKLLAEKAKKKKKKKKKKLTPASHGVSEINFGDGLSSWEAETNNKDET